MKYWQPFGITDTNASYINGDRTIGRAGSIIPAGAIESPQREIVSLIENSGLTPNDADLTQLLQAVRSQRLNYAIASNDEVDEQNDIVVNFVPPIGDTMTPGMPLRIKAAQTVTGPCTLSVDDEINPLRRANGAEIENLDIVAGQTFEVLWNDTFWAMTNYKGEGGGEGGTVNTYITKIPYAVDTGAANAIVANFSPAITNPVPGDAIEVKLANNITGAATITVNALAAVAMVRPNGAAMQLGDGVAGQIALLIYRDDNSWQFESIIPQVFTGMGVPVGSLILTLGNAAPSGTLKLNGATLVRAEHPLLWTFANASGRIVSDVDWLNAASRFWTSFSTGNGTTTFRLPDLRGEFMRFWDDARGIDLNRQLTVQQAEQVGAIVGGTGTVTITNPVIPNTMFQGFAVLVSSASGGAYGKLPGPGSEGAYWWQSASIISGDISLNINAGMENRVRNAPIVPCVVDG